MKGKILIIIIIILTLFIINGSIKWFKNRKIQFPHKDCPHLLQSYWESVMNKKNAKGLLTNWINAEYTKEEVDNNKIERIIWENRSASYFLELTTALPQKNNHIGYKYYKINNGSIYGLYCGK
jgi:hypothetical protein